MKRMGLYPEDEKRMAAIEEDTYKRMKKARAYDEAVVTAGCSIGSYRGGGTINE